MAWLQGGERLVDDAFFLRNVRVLEHAFDGQFHYGMFYAFVKLKEQEVKNLVRRGWRAPLVLRRCVASCVLCACCCCCCAVQVWICECLLQGQTHASSKFIAIFPKHK